MRRIYEVYILFQLRVILVRVQQYSVTIASSMSIFIPLDERDPATDLGG